MTGHNIPGECPRPDGGYQCDACNRPIKNLGGLSKHQLSCPIYERCRSRAIAKWGPPPPWSARHKFFLYELRAIRRVGWPDQQPGSRRRYSISSSSSDDEGRKNPGPNGDTGNLARGEMREPPYVSSDRGNDMPISSGQDRRVPAINLAANVATSSPSVSFSTRCPDCGKSVEDQSAHLLLHSYYEQQQPLCLDPSLQPGPVRKPDMDNPSRHLATATPNRDRDHGAAPPSSLDIANDGPAAKRRKLTMPAAEVEQPPISQSTCPLPTWLLKINEPKRTAEWLRLYFVSDDTAEMELNTILQAYEDTFAPYKAKYQRLGEPKFRKTFRATFEDAVLSRYALGTYSVQGIRPRDVPAALSTTPVPKEPLQRSGEAALPLPPSSRDGRAVLKCETNQTPVKEVQNHRAAPSSSSALSRARQVADERTINQAPIRRISYLSRSLPDWFLKVDEPKRSAEWLRLCFEPHPTSELGVNSLLQAYYTAFAPVAASHPHLVGPKFFALCRSTFTNVAFGSSPSGTYLIKGIKARAPPASSSTTLGTWSARSGEQLKQDEDRDGDKDRQNHTYSKPTSVSKALDFGLEPRNASLMGTPKLPEPQRRRNSSVGTLHSFHQGNAISGVPKHTSPWHGACENCRGNGKDHSFCYVSGKLYPGQGGRRVPGSGTKCGRCVKEGIPCVDVLRDGRTPDSHVSQKLKTDAERRATAGASTKEQTPVKAMPDVNEADSEVDLHYARMIHEKRISSETFSQLFRVHGIDPITTLFKWRSLVELSKTIT